jgi:hypothetical protein
MTSTLITDYITCHLRVSGDVLLSEFENVPEIRFYGDAKLTLATAMTMDPARHLMVKV